MIYFHVVYPPHQVVTTDYPVQCNKRYIATNIKTREEAQLIAQHATATYLEKMFNVSSPLHKEETNG